MLIRQYFYRLIALGFLVLGGVSSSWMEGQELNCTVKVVHSQVQGTNTEVFEALETAITEFMNNRTWTELQYQKAERVDCNLNITVKKYDEKNDMFSCELLFQVTRPVYNSGYSTTVFSMRDTEFSFSYNRQDALDFKAKSLGGVALGVIANDSRISVLAATKRYARDDEAPGTRYRIQRLSASMAVIPENADPGFREAFIPTMPSMTYEDAEVLASKLEMGKASKTEREAAELVRIAFVIPPFGVSSAEARQIAAKAFPKIRSIRSAF